MNKIAVTIGLILSICALSSCALFAQREDSGLPVGTASPAFDPQHAWGPDKGSHACPMCKYGYHPGVVFFLNSDKDWANTKTILVKLEQESIARKAKKFKAYLVYTNPNKEAISKLDSLLSQLGRELNIQHVALTYVPSIDDTESDMYQNKINPKTTNTIIVYNKRTVRGKFIDFVGDNKNFNELFQAVDRAGK